jgi:hypothetical protein
MPTGHEANPARLASHARGVEPGEPRPALGKTVDMRRFRIGMPVATEVAVTKVIGEDENDVGSVFRGCVGEPEYGRAQGDDDSVFHEQLDGFGTLERELKNSSTCERSFVARQSWRFARLRCPERR